MNWVYKIEKTTSLDWKQLVLPAARSGVPNLGYICLSEGVYLRLAEDEKNIFTYIYFQIFIYILLSIITKNYMLIVKYVYEW